MSMKEYRNPLWSRVGSDGGSNGQKLTGPLNSPLKAPACGVPPANAEQALSRTTQAVECIKNQLETDRPLASMVMDLLVPAYPPQYAIPFLPSPTAAVTLTGSGQGGTWTTLQTITLDAGYDGYITGYLGQVVPYTAWADVVFRITFNGTAVPKFDNNILPPTAMQGAQKYQRYIPQACKVAIQAKNNGSSDLLGQGMLLGWTAPIRRM